MLRPEAGRVAEAAAVQLDAAGGRHGGTNLDVAKLVDDQIARGRVVRFTTGGDIVIHKFSKSMRSRMWSSGKAGSVASWRRGAGQGDAVSQGRPATTKQRRNAVRNTHEKYKERESKRSSEAKAEAAKQHEAGAAAKAAIAARRIDIEQSVAAERAKQRDEQASMGVIDISVPDRHAATVEGGKRQAVVASAEVATAVKVAVRTPQHTPPPKTKRSMQFEVKGVEKGKGKGSAEKFKEITRGAKMVAAAAANGK